MHQKPNAVRTRMQGDERRRLIQEKAADLFSRQGYAKTSMREIADASGLQKGSLYHFYQSKEQLLLDLYRESLEGPQLAFDEIVAQKTSSREKLAQLITLYVGFYETMLPWMSTFTRGSLSDIEDPNEREQLSAMARRFQDTWDNIILDGMKSGEFRSNLDHKIVSFAILGAINWMYKWYDPKGRLPSSKIAENFVEAFLDGIAARRDP